MPFRIIASLVLAYLFALAPRVSAAQTSFTATTPLSPPLKPRGPGTPQTAEVIGIRCVPANSHPYGGKTSICEVDLNRQTPVAPLPLRVTKETMVQIRVKRRSNLETIQFVPTNAALSPIDLGSTLFTSLSGIIPGFVVSRPRTGPAAPNKNGTESAAAPAIITTDEDEKQSSIKADLESFGKTLNRDSDDLKRIRDSESSDKKIALLNDQAQTTADHQFDIYVSQFLGETSALGSTKDIDRASPEGIATRLKQLDIDLAIRAGECSGLMVSLDCETEMIRLQQNNALLNSALAKIQAKEQALITARAAIASLPAAGDYLYQTRLEPNVTSAVKISAKDVLSGTSTDLTTVTISWQVTSFSVSAGLMVSTMPGRAFANGPEIVNGVPTGVIKVTETDTKPSWVTPLALFNYEAASWRKGQWGFLISGGAGSNLTTKTADFAVGPSIRFRDLIITPALHYGKETILTNGVYVNETNLGSGITPPTGTEYRPHFGVAITYRIKLP